MTDATPAHSGFAPLSVDAHPLRERAVQYAFAVGFVVVAHTVTVLCWTTISPATHTIFLGAVVLTALYGGYGPGLLATALASLDIAYTFMPPYHSLVMNFDDLLFLVTFTAVALLTSSLQARRRSAEASLQRANDELERRVRDRTAELARSQDQLGLLVGDLLVIAEREQLRIGHDLHDGLGQELTGISMLTVALAAQLHDEGSAAAPHADQAAGLIQEAIHHARDLARGLSPIDLEDEGLAPALTRLADRVARLPGVRCTLDVAGTPTTDPAANIHLYRIAQEAINNALRHGSAHTVAITLYAAGGRLTLAVVDDGVGFTPAPAADPSAAPPADPAAATVPAGMGLRLMRQRARTIGASLDIRPAPAGGTMIVCELAT